MKRHLSLYLDLLRFAAAVIVLFGHAAGQRLTGGFLWPLGEYGPKAVMVFFVLSGFVIAYTAENKDKNLRDYTVARLARLYSVVPMALLLTAVVDVITMQVRPELYLDAWRTPGHSEIIDYVASFFFVGQLWDMWLLPGSNAPFWSLGYEAAYYVIFAAAFFLPKKHSLVVVPLLALFFGPYIISALPVWLLGVGIHYFLKRWQPGTLLGLVLFFGSFAMIGFQEIWNGIGEDHRQLLPLLTSMEQNLDVLSDYYIGIALAVNIIGFSACGHLFGGMLERLKKPIRITAGYTFSLYLFHMPALQLLASILPGEAGEPWRNATLYGGMAVIVVGLGQLSEQRKHFYRNIAERLVPKRSSVCSAIPSSTVLSANVVGLDDTQDLQPAAIEQQKRLEAAD